MSFWTDKDILLTGGAGFIGRHVHRLLEERGADPKRILVPRSAECDLRSWENCRKVCRGRNVVIHAAAVVGGIEFNRTHPGDVYYDNMVMNTHMMEAARQAGVEKYVAVSSACAYPLEAPVPLKEESFLQGDPEPTNAPYGYAKRMMLVQAQCYHRQYGMKCVVPVVFNAYGPWDDFDPETSHVIPALIKKCFEEEKLVAWGTGRPTRGFLFVEDAANGIVLAAEKLSTPEPVNIGTDEETSIRALVEMTVEFTGFSGPIAWDDSRPDGQPKRGADISRARLLLGYEPRWTLREGLKKTVEWYQETVRSGEAARTAK